MDRSEREKLYAQAVDTWGQELQILMLSEECMELATSTIRVFRGRTNKLAIASEIADVKIMIEQVVMMFDIEDIVESSIRQKLERLKDRLKCDTSSTES